MNARSRRAALGAAGGALLAAAAAAAVSVLDQQQTAVDPNAPGFALGGTSQQQVAQTVTTGVSGELREIQLPVSCTAGDLTAQIQTLLGTVPSGLVLTSRRIPAADLPPTSSPGVFRAIPLSPTPFLAAGERFAIVLGSSGLCEVQPGPAGDSYPRGEGLFRDRLAFSGVWLPLGPQQDLPFQTVVGIADPHVPGIDEGADNFVLVRCFVGALLP